MPYLALIVAQFLYTASDTWKKTVFGTHGFAAPSFFKPVFLAALVLAGVAFLFQMYALSRLDLSRTIIVMGMLAVLFSTAAGIIFFKEHFNAWNGLGVILAMLAIFLVHVK
jgi:drug/metabolite transporter (DMT)-like permease